jgi:hypothetical protein
MTRTLAALAVLVAGLAHASAFAQGTPPTGSDDGGGAKTVALPRCQGAPQCLPSFIARLKHAPFPIGADDDGEGGRFFHETESGTGLRVRINRHGDRYPEHIHYADPSVLFHVPAGFDRAKPFRLVVFFHGHASALEQDVVGRIAFLKQIDASGANVILIAPQLAKEAIDSHPGKLIRAGALARMLDEAAGVLARALGKNMAWPVARAPVILVAYSGGYRALAAGLSESGGPQGRVEGIVLLDTVFGEVRRIDEWLQARRGRTFLVGLYGLLSASWTIELMYRWEARGLRYRLELPARIGPGTVALAPVATDHVDIVTQGPPAMPLAEILRRLVPLGGGVE